MTLLNRYIRDSKFHRKIPESGCSIIADAHQWENDENCFALQLGVTFEIQQVTISSSEEKITYLYGFERARIDVKTNGCQIQVKHKLTEPASVKISVNANAKSKIEKSKNMHFSIGAALRGMIPGLKVEGGYLNSIKNDNESHITKTESSEYAVFSIEPVDESAWSLAGWSHPEGFLHGEICGSGAPLCVVFETDDSRHVEIQASSTVGDLRAERSKAGDSFLSDADHQNRTAVATALFSKAIKASERQISKSPERLEIDTSKITLAQTKIRSIDN